MDILATRQEIESKTKAFLAEEFEVDPAAITGDAPLKETLSLDSLDYVDLVVIIEENFGFKVQAEEFMQLRTFDDFYAYIERKTAKN